MKDLRVTLIQTSLAWENKQANLDMLSKKIGGIKEETDLVVLPEMFSTGFSMNSKELGEEMSGPTVSWLRKTALEKNAVITGSFICAEGGNYFNRLVWMRPDGTSEIYDKRHLFRMGNEQDHYSAGKNRVIVELNGWKICPLVCYDLRFPVWCRNVSIEGSPFLLEKGSGDDAYDILLFIANWPERRSYPWKILLQARAIENLSYVIAVNRIGKDGNDVEHSGDSVALNFKGEGLTSIPSGLEHIQTLSLNYSTLTEFRKQFPASKDSDSFSIRL